MLVANAPSLDGLLAEAKAQHAQALAEYDRIASYLRRRPIRPGWFYARSTWILRGEYEDVPRRFLDLRKPNLGRTQEAVLGDVDDIATELGFEDGDALREHLRTMRRPTLGEYVEALVADPRPRYDTRMGTDATNTDRQRRFRQARPAGICARCPRYMARQAMPGKTVCEDCAAKAYENLKAWRARRRAIA